MKKEERTEKKEASMTKEALISALANIIGKYGLRKATAWAAKRLGAPARGPVVKGITSAGKGLERAGKWLGSRPVLEDAALGATFPLLLRDKDTSYLGAAAESIPSMVGFGALMRSGGKAVSKGWEKLTGQGQKKASVFSADKQLAVKTLAGLLAKYTPTEHALAGAGVGAALSPLSSRPVAQNIAHGVTVGAGTGLGSLAGRSIAELLLKRYKLPAKLLTVPSASGIGAVGGGLAGYHLYRKATRPLDEARERKEKKKKQTKKSSANEMYETLVTLNAAFQKGKK